MSALPLPSDELHQLVSLHGVSEAHAAVALRWADELNLHDPLRHDFINRYLRQTSLERYWCIALRPARDGSARVLARLGNVLQRLNKGAITTIFLSSRLEASVDRFHAAPNEMLGSQLLRVNGTPCEGLLSSYSKAARFRAWFGVEKDHGANLQVHRNLGKLRAIRYKFHITQIGATIRAFNSHLDPVLLKATRSVGCPSSDLYNWLAAGNTQRRLQALHAQRILVPLLVLCQDACPNSDDPEAPCSPHQIIGRVADVGRSLSDSLAGILSVRAHAVRALGSASPYHAGSALQRINLEGPGTLGHSLLAGASLGNRMPRSRADWKTFLSLWYSVPNAARRAGLTLERLLVGTPIDWQDPAWPRICAVVHDCSEIFDHWTSAYEVVPQLCQEAGVKLDGFFGACTYRQLANLMQRYHAALVAIRAADQDAQQSRDLNAWPGLLPRPGWVEAPNGLRIVELLSSADLVAEHNALGHCIDTYDGFALMGTRRLFSIRQNDTSLASAELRQNGTGDLVLVQLRGPMNAPIPGRSPIASAFAWFMSHLRTNRPSLNLDWPKLIKSDRDKDLGLSCAVVEWIVEQVKRP